MKLALLEQSTVQLSFVFYIYYICVFNTCCCSFHYFHIRLEPKPCSSRKHYCVWCIFSVFSFDNAVFFSFCFFVARCDHHCVVECMRFGVLLDNTNVSIVCKTMFMYFKQKSSCISNPTNTILRWFKTLKYPHVNTEQRMLCELNILCLLFGVLNAIQYPTEYVLEQKNQWKKNQTRKEKKNPNKNHTQAKRSVEFYGRLLQRIRDRLGIIFPSSSVFFLLFSFLYLQLTYLIDKQSLSKIT